ncbi:hypothetical protein PYCCODRAFT_1201407 [Trametes coccinea BRFM310]|uniref:Uncharacterized protein n=1 Tax=Trametes coccinea (strain BRFM310) TaxID=1353009 RepID=A0A1Y2IAT7_TRAC3|nr:hypothetical protein PYCCODRAFT_1201407 [Trametes coccinea BRFM310]
MEHISQQRWYILLVSCRVNAPQHGSCVAHCTCFPLVRLLYMEMIQERQRLASSVEVFKDYRDSFVHSLPPLSSHSSHPLVTSRSLYAHSTTSYGSDVQFCKPKPVEVRYMKSSSRVSCSLLRRSPLRFPALVQLLRCRPQMPLTAVTPSLPAWLGVFQRAYTTTT